MTALVLPPPPDPLAAAAPDLGALVDADPEGDVVQAVADRLAARGVYGEDARFAALDGVARLATKRITLLTLYVVAPVVYEMRQTRGWARLTDPATGRPYKDFDEWAALSLKLSHTKATNLCSVHTQVLPMARRQGLDEASLKDVDESKVMLLVPLVQEHLRERSRILAEAAAHGTPREQVVLPPPPDLAGLLEEARTKSWADLREAVLTAQGVQKDQLELEFVVDRLDDGRYSVYARLTTPQMLTLDVRVRPRWLNPTTLERVNLHDELRAGRPPAAPGAVDVFPDPTRPGDPPADPTAFDDDGTDPR